MRQGPERGWWFTDMALILAISLMALAFVIGLWDVWHSYLGWPEDTVSWIIQEWSMRWPLLPFLAGVVVGHLLWPVRWPQP